MRNVYLDGDISDEDYRKERRKYRNELNRWHEEVEQLTADSIPIDLETFEEFATAARRVIGSATSFDQRRYCVEMLDVVVVIRPDRYALVIARGLELGKVPCD